MRIRFLILICCLQMNYALYAQQKNIVIIRSGSGLALVGANIKMSDGKTLWSDNDGSVVIKRPSGLQHLKISHLGYLTVDTTLIFPLTAIITIKLRLKPRLLDEVQINTGYQRVPKERATGSFFQLSNAVINQQVSPDIMTRISGQVSSLLVDKRTAAVTYQIRGLSTLTGTAMMPLIVLDDFPYEGDLANINPNDIESVTVLKDAAASSIWGARAGNGVIVLNSKKARSGQPLQINFNSSIGVQTKPDLFSANQLNPSATVDLQRYLFSQGNYDDLFNYSSMPPIPEVAEILNKVRNGTLLSANAEAQLDQLKQQDVRRDMAHYLYQAALTSQYALNLSAGTGPLSYFISAGYDQNRESLVGNGFKRFTLKSDNVINLNKNWKLHSGLMFTQSQSTNNSDGGYAAYKGATSAISAYSRLVDDDGNPLPVDLFYRGIYTDTAGQGRLLDWKYRPVQELKNNDKSISLNELLLSLSSDYNITPWLNAAIKYQYRQSRQENRNYYNIDSYFARNLINLYTQTGLTDQYIIPRSGILDQGNSISKSTSIRGQINADKTWLINNNLNAIAGVELRENVNSLIPIMLYGYNPQTLSTSNLDFANPYPTYDDLMGSDYLPGAGTPKLVNNRFVSLYANAAYNYGNKYTISASVRKDASNLFGVLTNQRWVPLWSIGLSWNLAEESFYKFKFLPQLKLRMSYGFSGNLDATASALARITYNSAFFSPINIPSIDVSSPPNPSLRWEKTKQFNAGADFGLNKNLLTVAVDYFSKYSFDLMNSVKLDPTSGFSEVSQNSAAIKSNGVDLVVNSVNLQGRIGWKTTFLFSQVKYKVVKNLNSPGTEGLATDGSYIFPIVGYNPYVIVSYKWAGLDPQNGDPIGDVNGVPSKDYEAISLNPIEQQVVHGSALPVVFGNLRNTFNWRGINLAININYKFGYYFRRPSLNYNSLFQNSIGYSEYENRWKKSGDEQFTNVPSLIYPGNAMRDNFYKNSSINVEKGDHIRLNEIYLSYQWKPFKLKFIKQSEIYLFSNQLNILLWRANKLHLDPEQIYQVKQPEYFAAGLKLNL